MNFIKKEKKGRINFFYATEIERKEKKGRIKFFHATEIEKKKKKGRIDLILIASFTRNKFLFDTPLTYSFALKLFVSLFLTQKTCTIHKSRQL